MSKKNKHRQKKRMEEEGGLTKEHKIVFRNSRNYIRKAKIENELRLAKNSKHSSDKIFGGRAGVECKEKRAWESLCGESSEVVMDIGENA